ncbi:iron-only hydrogenase system regulator [Tractidigestivibacter scatoligenes]|jgi:putative iron-only hydrogenase system regulator|uniref:Iron-only hydrogenase system regulator n=1 Tax=Tractidigestivibacter scatoligenes TaxID=1299998 RepID=A0A117J4C2_TRASO|nr:TM1266 family iron-only hydrogenase system putative regulator [Tractidigestivibacter scatoligenes]KUH58166.1 iron-only hydrogenase system regulator [Tractidigestivibacter scatoligenes]
METRVAVLGIIVEDPDSVAHLNEVLHENAGIIIGRMGIPYPKRRMNIISVAVDAPQDAIAALAGRIGAIPGVSVRAAYSK